MRLPRGAAAGARISILPDFSYIKNRLDKVDALVLTHGHEDHIGGVPYLLKLRPDIPLIGSKLTLAFVDAKCKEHHQNPTKVEVAGREKLKVGPTPDPRIRQRHPLPSRTPWPSTSRPRPAP